MNHLNKQKIKKSVESLQDFEHGLRSPDLRTRCSTILKGSKIFYRYQYPHVIRTCLNLLIDRFMQVKCKNVEKFEIYKVLESLQKDKNLLSTIIHTIYTSNDSYRREFFNKIQAVLETNDTVSRMISLRICDIFYSILTTEILSKIERIFLTVKNKKEKKIVYHLVNKICKNAHSRNAKRSKDFFQSIYPHLEILFDKHYKTADFVYLTQIIKMFGYAEGKENISRSFNFFRNGMFGGKELFLFCQESFIGDFEIESLRTIASLALNCWEIMKKVIPFFNEIIFYSSKNKLIKRDSFAHHSMNCMILMLKEVPTLRFLELLRSKDVKDRICFDFHQEEAFKSRNPIYINYSVQLYDLVCSNKILCTMYVNAVERERDESSSLFRNIKEILQKKLVFKDNEFNEIGECWNGCLRSRYFFCLYNKNVRKFNEFRDKDLLFHCLNKIKEVMNDRSSRESYGSIVSMLKFLHFRKVFCISNGKVYGCLFIRFVLQILMEPDIEEKQGEGTLKNENFEKHFQLREKIKRGLCKFIHLYLSNYIIEEHTEKILLAMKSIKKNCNEHKNNLVAYEREEQLEHLAGAFLSSQKYSSLTSFFDLTLNSNPYFSYVISTLALRYNLPKICHSFLPRIIEDIEKGKLEVDLIYTDWGNSLICISEGEMRVIKFFSDPMENTKSLNVTINKYEQATRFLRKFFCKKNNNINRIKEKTLERVSWQEDYCYLRMKCLEMVRIFYLQFNSDVIDFGQVFEHLLRIQKIIKELSNKEVSIDCKSLKFLRNLHTLVKLLLTVCSRCNSDIKDNLIFSQQQINEMEEISPDSSNKEDVILKLKKGGSWSKSNYKKLLKLIFKECFEIPNCFFNLSLNKLRNFGVKK